MGYSSIRPKVRRRKVANLAAMSRQFSVRNCTIPKADPESIIDIKVSWSETPIKGTKGGGWDIPKEGYPQCKSLRKRCKGQKYVNGKLIEWDYPSEYPDFTKRHWKAKYGKSAKMEAYVQDKLKKWEKKHPKPCPTDDLFKDEFIPMWEKDREEALARIRDFVVSIYDKLPLTGRFKTGEHKFDEKKVADIKDVNGDGHKVNEVKPDSKLIKKAQEVTNKVHAKHANLISTNLRDHKRTKGRIILPKAA